MTVMTTAAHEKTVELSETARRNVASHASCPNDFRELALMLGIAEQDFDGDLVPACPWDDYDPDAGKTKRMFHTLPW